MLGRERDTNIKPPRGFTWKPSYLPGTCTVSLRLGGVLESSHSTGAETEALTACGVPWLIREGKGQESVGGRRDPLLRAERA